MFNRFVLPIMMGIVINSWADNSQLGRLSSGASGTGESNPAELSTGFSAGASGAVNGAVQDKLRQFVEAEDFGTVGNAQSDDAPVLMRALAAACPGKGVTFRNRLFLASPVTIPANCELRGPLANNVSEQASGNYNVKGTILLASNATISLAQGATLAGAYILNNALRNSLPFPDAASAATAVAGYSGTAVLATGADVQLRDLWIGGFALAFSSSGKERTKIQRVQIDSTNGIAIHDSFDIARISDVHAWPFLTAHRPWTTPQSARRKGSAFRVTGHFDAGYLFNCFDYGWDVGFDIQSLNEVDIINSFSDGAGLGVGQIGFKITGAAELVNISGGGASGKDVGVYINVDNPETSGAVSLNGIHLWGNHAHIVSDAHRVLNIVGAYLRDTNGGSRAGVSIGKGVTGITSVSSSVFDTPGIAFAIAPGLPTRNARISNNVYRNSRSDFFENRVSDNSSAEINSFSYSASPAGHVQNFYQSAGSAARPERSPNGAQLATTNAYVQHGSGFGQIAKMRAVATALPTPGSTPGEWIFSTTPATAMVAMDRIKIAASGDFLPVSDNAISNGAAGNRWSSLHAYSGYFGGQTAAVLGEKLSVNGRILGMAPNAALTAYNPHAQTSMMLYVGDAIPDQRRLELYANNQGNFAIRSVDDAYSASGMLLSAQRGNGLTWSTVGLNGNKFVVDAVGNALVRAHGGLGYGQGSGASIRQSGGKSSPVELNTPTGQIALSASPLVAAGTACFILNNSSIAASDVLNVAIASGATAGAYSLQVDATAPGAARLCLRNLGNATLSESLVINFALIKGAVN